MERSAAALLRHFREAFARDPVAAYRDWYRAQEELADEDRADEARALADDLWAIRSEIVKRIAPGEERARFVHNAAVFYGSPGPAGDLSRARTLFEEALAWFESSGDEGWRARIEHNFATALSNLGATAADLEESLSLFERALGWRTAEREIARGVTLHNLGLALRRLAELDPARAADLLAASARALAEACEIRTRRGLAEGRASSLFQRGVTLLRLHEASGEERAREDAAACLEESAALFETLGKRESAATAGALVPR